MEPATYRNAIAAYVEENALPRDKFIHQQRVYQLAGTLGRGTDFDDDILFAAAWLHDLGVFLHHRPQDPAQLACWDHVAYALREVPGILSRLGFPGVKIPAVLEGIRTHLPSKTPVNWEGVLLRDADILEQLGATGIARMLSKVGRDTRYPTHAEAIAVLQQSARQLPKLLRLPQAKELAANRVALMEAFFSAYARESGGQPAES